MNRPSHLSANVVTNCRNSGAVLTVFYSLLVVRYLTCSLFYRTFKSVKLLYASYMFQPILATFSWFIIADETADGTVVQNNVGQNMSCG
jgi:hypothetical protein